MTTDQDSSTESQPTLTYVGEGKKYASIEDLDKGYAHANTFIEQLKKEKAELEQKMKEQLFDKKVQENPTPKTSDAGASDKTSNVEDIVRSVLKQESQRERQERNARDVQTFLFQKFGEQTSEKLKQKAAELETSVEDLERLAASQPGLIKSLFSGGQSAMKTDTPNPSTSVETTAYTSGSDDEKEFKAMKQELRKNPYIAATKPGWHKRYETLRQKLT